jgi:pimeloyl-ACP methyl ester carboxylesterase
VTPPAVGTVRTVTNAPRDHRSLADPDSRFVRIGGIEVHHKVAGDGAPPVVLLHHFWGNVATWRKVLPEVAAFTRVVAFDRPGFGLTERSARPRPDGIPLYTRAGAVAITIGLLDHLGIDRAVLVGSSAGGTVALETYAQHPDRVAGLLLLSPAITGDVGPPPQLRALLRKPLLRRAILPIVTRRAGGITRQRVAAAWHDPSLATDDDALAYQRAFEVTGWDTSIWHVLTAEPPPDLRAVLRRIDVPTIVATGVSDRVVRPAASRATAAAIPGAEFVAIDRAGHTPQEERPAVVVDLVRHLVTGL